MKLAALAAAFAVMAAPASASKWRNEKSGRRALEQSAAGPQDFQKAVENWQPAPGDAALPEIPPAERLPRPVFKSALPLPSVAPSALPHVRALSDEALALRAEPRPAPALPLSPLATNVFLGLSSIFLAGCLMTGGWEKAAEEGAADVAAGAETAPSIFDAPAAAAEAETETMAQAIASLPPRFRLRAALADPEPVLTEPFLDPRMPVRTWRAITLNEQRAIDAWNVSADKASGRADLFDWLDANAAEGVDAATLKRKLSRDS